MAEAFVSSLGGSYSRGSLLGRIHGEGVHPPVKHYGIEVEVEEIQRAHELAAERLRSIRLDLQPVEFPYADQAPRAPIAILYSEKQAATTVIAAAYRQLFSQVDLLLTPVAPVWSYRMDQPRPEPVSQTRGGGDGMTLLISYSGPFELTGLPAISLTVAIGTDGLPIGAQLVGPAFGEAVLLRVARALEQAVAPRLAEARARRGTLVAA